MQITDVSEFIDHEKGSISLVISWSDEGEETLSFTQFGELYIECANDGQIKIDTESMGKDHFLKVMELLYDMAEIK